MTTAELLRTIESALELRRSLTLADSADTVEGWDSLGHLAILVELDKRLNGRAAAIAALATCESVQQLADQLRAHQLLTD